MEKFEYRAYIKTRALLGVSAQAISDELVLVHGNQAPKYSTVAKWNTLFKDGRESLEDDPRSGHPRTTNGPWRLCDIITGDESWFYLRQVGHKSANASWVGEGESPRTIVRCDRFQPKNMFYIFFKTTGVVHFGYVEKGDTITSKYYIKKCLKPLICKINKQRPKTGTQNFKFLHDNARPHVTETVTNCLNQAGITIIRHPPYSPDLAPSNYWLFDLIKKNLDDDTDVESQKNLHNEATSKYTQRRGSSTNFPNDQSIYDYKNDNNSFLKKCGLSLFHNKPFI
ncbi:histone-lysine N-methyltransferase SETMAR-like [Hydra vulgaris]|uniref:Histone-lysine N-methyltransferase SETMAR-like n=1 Tax=Hydra vulgaris TaxID=6087 RepID=A0ABM4B1E5_HYDVU